MLLKSPQIFINWLKKLENEIFLFFPQNFIFFWFSGKISKVRKKIILPIDEEVLDYKFDVFRSKTAILAFDLKSGACWNNGS